MYVNDSMSEQPQVRFSWAKVALVSKIVFENNDFNSHRSTLNKYTSLGEFNRMWIHFANKFAALTWTKIPHSNHLRHASSPYFTTMNSSCHSMSLSLGCTHGFVMCFPNNTLLKRSQKVHGLDNVRGKNVRKGMWEGKVYIPLCDRAISLSSRLSILWQWLHSTLKGWAHGPTLLSCNYF